MNTIRLEITSDTPLAVYEHLFDFIKNQNEKYNIQIQADFFSEDIIELSKRLLDLGAVFTPILCPSNIKENTVFFFDLIKDRIKNIEYIINFPCNVDVVEYLKFIQQRYDIADKAIKVYCTVDEENFDQIVILKEKFDKSGLNLNLLRKLTANGWVEYREEIEDYVKSKYWLKTRQDIDISYDRLKNRPFTPNKSVCRCGEKFFRVLPDGRVKRCFSDQISGWDILGDFAQTSNVRKFKKYSPCFSQNCQCKNYSKLKLEKFIFDKEDVLIDNREEKFDVAIVGFGWTYNYGALLTNYGMMKQLEKFKLKTLMIDKPRDFTNVCYHDSVYAQTFSRKFNEKHFTMSRIYNDKNL